jgi:hypothetical protein
VRLQEEREEVREGMERKEEREGTAGSRQQREDSRQQRADSRQQRWLESKYRGHPGPPGTSRHLYQGR